SKDASRTAGDPRDSYLRRALTPRLRCWPAPARQLSFSPNFCFGSIWENHEAPFLSRKEPFMETTFKRTSCRIPWNKGKLVGQSIFRSRLQSRPSKNLTVIALIDRKRLFL